MSKEFAWELFKNTGNVDAFMIMRDIENSSNTLNPNAKNMLGGIDGNIKNEGNSNQNC